MRTLSAAVPAMPIVNRQSSIDSSLPPLRDIAPSREQFLDDVLEGLQAAEKSLPCKYFYDRRGSELFEQICELDEYYLTRCELEIMQSHAAEMARCLGPRCVLVELGSGSSVKTAVLLENLERPAGFVPVEISRAALRETAARLDRRFPRLEVRPVCADFTEPFAIPPLKERGERTVVYFPGSTIGNFGPPAAGRLLERIAGLCSPGGGLLIGVDLRKPRDIVEPAYNDAQGVTARFNLNLLARINRELDADFDLDAFEHLARFDEDEGRVEIHLVSKIDQRVQIAGREIDFARGERIHTENSYKYSLDGFRELAERAGFDVQQTWFDSRRLFSVQYLVVSGEW